MVTDGEGATTHKGDWVNRSHGPFGAETLEPPDLGGGVGGPVMTRARRATSIALTAAGLFWPLAARASESTDESDTAHIDASTDDGAALDAEDAPLPQTCAVPRDCAPVDFTRRAFVAHAILGAGTPVGLFGLELEYNVASRLALGLGAGVGAGGPQYAALARGRPFVFSNAKRALAITLDVAFSLGRYRSTELYLPVSGNEHYHPNPQHQFIDTAYWLQFDIGFERRNRNGMSFLVSGGLGWILDPDRAYCKDDASDLRVACEARALGDTPGVHGPRLMLTGAIGHDLL